MDFLNPLYTRLTDLLKSMTPGARITAGLLLSMVVISLAYLVNHASTGSGMYLMGGEPFAAAQLPVMLAAFDKAGLHDAQTDGNRIRVPMGKESAYMGALASAGAIPPTFGSYLEKSAVSNPWISAKQQEEAKKIAKQLELQNIIGHMQGIESAAVMYDIEVNKAFGAEKLLTASVNVKPLGSAYLDENQVRMVRHLVAAAIAGLKPGSVTVTDLNGRTYPGTGASGGLGGGDDDPYNGRKRVYEREWSDKIASALSYIPGVIVAADVELEPETTHEEQETQFDPKTVPYQQRDSATAKVVRTGGAGGGRPGPTAQQHGSNQPAVVGNSGTNENTEENTLTDTSSAVSTKTTRVVNSPLVPKRVKVAVTIPSSYYERIWAERNPPAPGQEPKKPDSNALADIESKVKTDVQNAVVALLPTVSATADPFPRVTVTSFQYLPGQQPVAPTMPDKALAWAGQYWSTLGMIGLALVSLVMLRSMVRATPSTPATAAQLDIIAGGEQAGDDGEAAPRAADAQTVRSRLRRRPPGEPSLRDELSELVKEDPDSAVSVLRAWIGNAS